MRPLDQPHGPHDHQAGAAPCLDLLGRGRAASGRRRRLTVGSVAVVVVWGFFSSVVAATPAVRVLTVAEARDAVDQATQHLAEAHAEVSRAEAAIAEANASLGDLQADQLALTNQLRSKRRQARQLSVAAYMSGGTESSIELLADTEQASDLLWRQTMLSEQSLDTRKVAREFQQLRNGTSAQVDHVVDRLDRLDRRLEEARQEIPHAERQVTLAQIALIGAQQAAELARAARDAAALGLDRWSALRRCESGGDYTMNSGNGFYGAYQFDLQTWQSVGGTGLPSDAPPWEQDARARALYSARGDEPWPICGKFLRSAT